MVLKRNFLLVLILVNLLNLNFAYSINEYIMCNRERSLGYGIKELYIYYPDSRASPASCKYLVKSPVGTFIFATIYHNISGAEPSCVVQRLLISRSGDLSMRDASKFCGKRSKAPLQINSIGNEMSFELQSKKVSGTLQVVIRYVNITQRNCDCR